MPLTATDAYNQLKNEMKKLGSWSPGNMLDAIIGVGSANTDELQRMLNQVLEKKGVLSETDEAAIKDLLDRQEQERKKRQKIRTKNVVFISGAVVIIGSIIYVAVRKMKK
jgi:hypothetical protein